METTDKKLNFIKLRAENNSYSKISKKLNISKDTCSKWENEFIKEITRMKQEQLEELYTAYFLHKESRIKQLGESFNAINQALDKKDLSELSPEKLLEYKLKYISELKKEYIQLREKNTDEATPENILSELFSLIGDVRSGHISTDQAMKENHILLNILKAFETVDLKKKLELLENIIGGRK